jgi:hypothetical protein
MYNIRSIYKYIPLLFFTLLVCACSNDSTRLGREIAALDANKPDVGSYVIIPNQGCEGCISTAEAFVKKHINSPDGIKYIFTRIQSVKLLRIKLGDSVVFSKKVLLDTTNMIEYPDKEKEIYPMIVVLSGQKVLKVMYQSPDDDGFKLMPK